MLEKINDWHIFDILYEIMNMKLLKVKVFINIFRKKLQKISIWIHAKIIKILHPQNSVFIILNIVHMTI